MEKKALFPKEPKLAKHKRQWVAAGQISDNRLLTPFTAKALYAFGMMRHLIESAGWSLTHNCAFHVAGYLLSFGAIELLGCCIAGNSKENRKARHYLECGLKRIASLTQDSDDNHVIVKIGHKRYTVRDCVVLRNYCAHGASAGKVTMYPELIGEILGKLAGAMDDYWKRLMDLSDDESREKLALAAIAPIFVYGRAIHVSEVYGHIQRGAAISGDLMHRDAWQACK